MGTDKFVYQKNWYRAFRFPLKGVFKCLPISFPAFQISTQTIKKDTMVSTEKFMLRYLCACSESLYPLYF